MKKGILLPVLLLFFQFTKAQDTIVKFNGDQILSKIIEINATQVKYKKFNFQDGPSYVEEKSTIHFIKYSNGMKEEFTTPSAPIVIKENSNPPENKNDYYGGPSTPSNKIENWGSYYQYKGYRFSERELHKMLLQTKDKRIITLVGNAKDAHKMQFIGFGAIPLGIAAMYFLETSIMGNNPYGTGSSTNQNSSNLALSGICLIGAVACPIVSGINKHKRTSCNRQAVKLYNETY